MCIESSDHRLKYVSMMLNIENELRWLNFIVKLGYKILDNICMKLKILKKYLNQYY